MKTLRNIVITLLILSGVFVGSGLLISHFFGKEVKNAVIARLNDKLKVEVDVEEVDFSVLRKFPYASVGLSNVRLTKQKDSLFHFEEVFLQFDVTDLFTGIQRIERISFENGELRLPIDVNGDHPYSDIWRTDTQQQDTASAFELERMIWENVDLEYSDQRNGTAFSTHVSYGFLQARFGADSSELRTRIEGTWKELHLQDRKWEKVDRPYSIRANGRIDNRKRKVGIQKGELTWNGAEGKVDGSITYGNESRLDLHYRFPYHSIQTYFEAWPGLFRSPKNYTLDGRMRFEGAWEGPIGRSEGPVLKGKLGLKGGSIQHESSGIEAGQLRAKGRFSTREEGGRPIIRLSRFSGKLGGGEWKGKGNWSPGKKHRFEVHLNGKSRVQETVRFLGIDTLRNASGDWEASVRVKARISDFTELSAGELEAASISGKAELKDATFAVKGNRNEVSKLDGTFLLHGMDAAVKKLTGRIAGSDLELEGRFHDLLPYLLLPDRTLRVDAELRSDRIDLDELLKDQEKSGSGSSKAYHLSFPEDLHFRLSADVQALKFRSFHPKELSGNFELGPGGFSGNAISMRIAEGELSGYMVVNASRGPYEVRAGADLKKIRIRPFFQAFESFGQELIRPEHLRGVLDADIRYSSTLEKDLGIPPASVLSTANIELRKGELIQFDPLLDLGKELASKKILNSFLDLERLSKELHHVRFNTLKNRIRIEDESVIIPRFDVRSNALDITASGRHGFDGRIDHHFVILMDELLSKPKKSEFGYLKDEGREKRLFVKMTGTTEDPRISFDRKAASEFREKRRKDEKKDVKDALRKEFGLFGGKDSLSDEAQKEKKEKSDPVFDVKWGSDKKEKGEKEKKEKEEKSFWDRLGIGGEEEKEKKKEEEK